MAVVSVGANLQALTVQVVVHDARKVGALATYEWGALTKCAGLVAINTMVVAQGLLVLTIWADLGACVDGNHFVVHGC